MTLPEDEIHRRLAEAIAAGEVEYHPGYFGAYVLDPDGNNVEAVFHDRDGAPSGDAV